MTPGNSEPAMQGVVSTVSDSESMARSTPTAERAEPDPGDDLAGVPGQHLPGRRQGGRAAGTVDQPHPELPLQPGDVRADPGLGPVHVLGGSREPPAVDHREKRLQPVQLHPSMIQP